MTRFTVIWQEDAINDVAELWMGADDSGAVTIATHTIQTLLSYNPSLRGSEIREGLRAVVSWPLRAVFEVREDDRFVDIWRVYRV